MAIGTNAAIEFFGTEDTVSAGGGTSAVSSGAFSASGDATSWTNDDDAPNAIAQLEVAFTTAPTANRAIHLFARLLNVNSTNDEPQPDASYFKHYLGIFKVDAVGSSTTQYLVSGDFKLPNKVTSQEYEFYLFNDTDQSMNASWVLKITPKTIGPHG